VKIAIWINVDFYGRKNLNNEGGIKHAINDEEKWGKYEETGGIKLLIHVVTYYVIIFFGTRKEFNFFARLIKIIEN
jgi:hypothetical protein